MNKVKGYSLLTVMLSSCMLFFSACSDKSAEGEWCEEKPFDHAEYDRSYDIYLEHFDDDEEDLPRLYAVSDSLFKAGEKAGNYAVQINALVMKTVACSIKQDADSCIMLYREGMKIARQNGNQHLYFSLYNNLCHELLETNAEAAICEARNMLNEANELDNMDGRKYAHRILGDIFQYRHNNSASAIKEYDMAYDFAKKAKSTSVYMFDLEMDMALAYASAYRMDDARKMMALARESEEFNDTYFQTSYNITLLSIIEKEDSAKEEFNEIYKKVFDDASARSRFYDEQLLDWHVRYLIVNGQLDEAEAEIAKMQSPDTQKNRLAEVYCARGDYHSAYLIKERMYDIRDSIRYEINMADIISMETELHNIELKRTTAEAIAHRRFTIIVAVGILLLFVIVTSIIFIHRQRIATKRLEKANSVKSQFLHSMSHELRTPLNHISGFAQLLDSGVCDDDPDAQRESVRAIVNGANTLTHMIENSMLIIDEAGEQRMVEMSCADIENLVTKVIGQVHVEEGKQIEIKKNIKLPDAFLLKSSDVMIMQVLTNVLNNAEKFTQEGSITLDVYLDSETKPSKLFFACTDTGCGVAPEHREKIFERFFKADEFVPGIGLGLSVCRVMADRLHGSIVLDDSYEGTGARFVFSVPV